MVSSKDCFGGYGELSRSKPASSSRVELHSKGEVVDLMIEHGVGVEPIRVTATHRINEGFVDEL